MSPKKKRHGEKIYQFNSCENWHYALAHSYGLYFSIELKISADFHHERDCKQNKTLAAYSKLIKTLILLDSFDSL